MQVSTVLPCLSAKSELQWDAPGCVGSVLDEDAMSLAIVGELRGGRDGGERRRSVELTEVAPLAASTITSIRVPCISRLQNVSREGPK